MALNDAGSTMKVMFGNLVSVAQDRMNGGGGSSGGGGGYNNNFLLREDSMEQQQGYPNMTSQQQQQQQPQMMDQSNPATADAATVSGYSMLSYGKTFCQDLYAFVMQLPPLGKGVLVVVLLALWLLMRG
jgi:hypothetical protein